MFEKKTSTKTKKTIKNDSKKEKLYCEGIEAVISYMKENINTCLTFDAVLKHTDMCEAYLKKYFRKKTGLSVMRYFKNMKIEEAKKLMKTSNMNFTEISEQLGYDSIHYFSRQFKAITGMNPTQYRNKERNDK